MTRPPCLTWVHIGDLHMDEANGWQSRDRLAAIVAEINDHVGDAADFVYLPGDNANHATVEQYRVITDTLAALRLPYRVIPAITTSNWVISPITTLPSPQRTGPRRRSSPGIAASSSTSFPQAPVDPTSG